jgi:hypothetical protein
LRGRELRLADCQDAAALFRRHDLKGRPPGTLCGPGGASGRLDDSFSPRLEYRSVLGAPEPGAPARYEPARFVFIDAEEALSPLVEHCDAIDTR